MDHPKAGANRISARRRSSRPLARGAFQRQHGFTLIELMVVLSIIAVLVGLLLSAVQRARSAAMRVQCANQLHQIGIAFQRHHDTFGVFPSNGGWDGVQTIKATDGSQVEVYTWDLTMPTPYHWGVGVPNVSPQAQTGCWAYAILPYLEQVQRYEAREWTTPLGLYICPARRPVVAERPVNDSHAIYSGGGWTWGKTDYAANYFVVSNRPACMPISAITDGTSQTILVGEKAMSPSYYTAGGWFWDEPFFLGGSDSTARKGDQVLADSRSLNQFLRFRENWGSAHLSGSEFLFSDLSVRSLLFSISPDVVYSLMTPNGAEVLQDY